jgi:PAS domain S-box-containing protein
MKVNKIIPNEHELKMKENDFIVSKTDAKGVITYCNEVFMEMAGYMEEELLGKNHNIIRHPDMPKIAFKLAWDLISSGKEFFGFVKNLTKDGSYYWVFANISPDYNENGKIVGYTSVRRKPSQKAIDTIIPIYKKLCELEKSTRMNESSKFLFDFLDENKITYDELILSLQGE